VTLPILSLILRSPATRRHGASTKTQRADILRVAQGVLRVPDRVPAGGPGGSAISGDVSATYAATFELARWVGFVR
jgi:hypothetical protein